MARSVIKPHLKQLFDCKGLEKTEEEKKFEANNGKYWRVKSDNTKSKRR